ncbi:MAG TPA: hypothetical protein VI895_09185 [Bdellovibrionota bacterium]|nr:hypothetical protein [Bdellovibrionota bacterium]
MWHKAFLEECRRAGFNLAGIASVTSYDSSTPEPLRLARRFSGARSALILATGGTSFWNSLAQREKSCSHPLDRATVHRLRKPVRFLRRQGVCHRILFPFRSSGLKVSFRRLAEASGLGNANTVLNILVHPVYGPWVSLRALILVDQVLEPTVPLTEFDPCAPCAKPCIRACPSNAIRTTGFELRLCGIHISKFPSCDEGCLARRACVYGKEHAYSGNEGFHRQRFAKQAILQYLARES